MSLEHYSDHILQTRTRNPSLEHSSLNEPPLVITPQRYPTTSATHSPWALHPSNCNSVQCTPTDMNSAPLDTPLVPRWDHNSVDTRVYYSRSPPSPRDTRTDGPHTCRAPNNYWDSWQRRTPPWNLPARSSCHCTGGSASENWRGIVFFRWVHWDWTIDESHDNDQSNWIVAMVLNDSAGVHLIGDHQ